MEDLSLELKDVVFDNPIWVASSPFTENYKTIEKVIEKGAASVVLRTAGDFELKCERNRNCSSCGNRYVFLWDTNDNYVVSTTLRNLETCDRLTIEEANKITNQIKTRYPDCPVIESFGPATVDEFESVNNLEADVIELNTRYYQRSSQRPLLLYTYEKDRLPKLNPNLSYPMGVHQGLSEDVYRKILGDQELFLNEQERIVDDFKKLARIVDRPTLLKLVAEPELPLEKQLELDVDGFTPLDSIKWGRLTNKNGFGAQYWGKGSISGNCAIANMSRYMIELIRETHPEKFISASGGIFNINDVKNRLSLGANSIQLCSAIYYYGFDQIERILNDLKYENQESILAKKTYEVEVKHPSFPIPTRDFQKYFELTLETG